MEDEASVLLDGNTLGNLRVVDLKQELEKRGLSKSGSKKELVKRLKQQLEFEKLCDERKSSGECDLKLELDADTEKNEFVQQYLAQQQKIIAVQKEAKRLIELEEIQKSSDERESCESAKEDDVDNDDDDGEGTEPDEPIAEDIQSEVITNASNQNASFEKSKISTSPESRIECIEPNTSLDTSSKVAKTLKTVIHTADETTEAVKHIPDGSSDAAKPSPDRSSEVVKLISHESFEEVRRISEESSEAVKYIPDDSSEAVTYIADESSEAVAYIPDESSGTVKLVASKFSEVIRVQADSSESAREPCPKTSDMSEIIVKVPENLKEVSCENTSKKVESQQSSLSIRTVDNNLERSSEEIKTVSVESVKDLKCASAVCENISEVSSRFSKKSSASSKKETLEQVKTVEVVEMKPVQMEEEVPKKRNVKKVFDSLGQLEKVFSKLSKKASKNSKLSKNTSEGGEILKEMSKEEDELIKDLPEEGELDRDTAEEEGELPRERETSSSRVQESKRTNSDTVPKATNGTQYVSRKISLAGRKTTRKSEDEPKAKKSKWGSLLSSQKPQAISISTDSLKNWFPDFKLLKEPVNEAVSDLQEREPISKNENGVETVPRRLDNVDARPLPPKVSRVELEKEEEMDVEEESGSVSKILFIQNLVRPFTLNQLKDLLRERGDFVEEEFWIDKIKSKCFATYETEEDARKTKRALNNARWPSSNPKILIVDYSNEEEMNFHKSGGELPKAHRLSLPDPQESHEVAAAHPLDDFRKKEYDRDHKRGDRSQHHQPMREWDKDKISQESPERERNVRDQDRPKHGDKKERKDSKRRANEDTPAKLLDDLFQKTKSLPCIYWLPLTDELVQEREEMKRQRHLEREKRFQKRDAEEAESKNKPARTRNRARETDTKRSTTRSRSPPPRRR